MEWVEKVLAFLKLPFKHIWVIAIVSGLLLFLPDKVLNNFNLVSFVSDFASYIGAVFLVSIVLIVVNVSVSLWKILRRKRLRRIINKMQTKALQQLDSQEKSVLREFYLQGQKTIRMPVDQPVVAGLVRKVIIVQVGQLAEQSIAGMLISVTLAVGVEQKLTSSMIDMPTSKTNSDIDWLKRNRPKFMPEIIEHNRIFHTSPWRTWDL